ncbi:type IV secretory system conjugative DNA transfer family protein [Nonomuraea sp. NPDC052129]|uniref:type IV secretory system conjugative DNA transfer family protein n=1 Tax=Nonomuraea sp. NPDC052129 TaxID=3154651 RepID=UPI00342095C1
MLTSQVVRIRRIPGDGKPRTGTGYLIDEQTVITTAHCVASGSNLEIFFSDGEDRLPIARTHLHATRDLAILKLSVGHRVEGVLTPTLGMIGGHGDVILPVEFAGFPRVQRRVSGERLMDWVPGDLYPLAAQDDIVFSIDVRSAIPRRRDEEASPWGGMSGAPVLSFESYFIAVVAHDHTGFDGRVQAIAVQPALLEDDDFASHLPEEWRTPGATDLAGLVGRVIDDEMSIKIKPPTESISKIVEERLDRSPAELVSARHAIVEFRERVEVEELRSGFLDTEQRLQVALLHGPGGGGKSRIAARLYEIARAAGWTAGQVTSQTPGATDRPFRVNRPLLLIFDYAETEVQAIKRLLTYFMNQGALPKIRILLVARSKTGPWLVKLKAHRLGGTIPDVLIPLRGDQLTDDARLDHYGLAAATFARCLRMPWTPPETAPDLSADIFELPLLIHIRALLDVFSGSVATDDVPGEELLDRLLIREWEKYWQPSLAEFGLDAEQAGELVALSSLTAAENLAEATELLRAAKRSSGLSDDVREKIAEALSGLYPSGGSYLSPVQPDLLSEQLIATHLLDVRRLTDVLARCLSPRQKAHLLQVLQRMTNSPLAATAERSRSTLQSLLEHVLPDLVGEAVATATKRSENPPSGARTGLSLARTLAEVMDVQPVPATAAQLVELPIPQLPELLDLAVRLKTQGAEHLKGEGEVLRATKAWREAADILIRQGNMPGALAAVSQSSRLGALLPSDGPAPALLAGTHAARASIEISLGHLTEGRELAKKAVDGLRTQGIDTAAARTELSRALSVLSITLVNSRDYPQALDVVSEAIHVAEKAMENDDPDSDLSLAGVLMTQTIVRQLGDPSGSVDSARRMVRLLRDRATKDNSAEVSIDLIPAECLLADALAADDCLDEAAEVAQAARAHAEEFVSASAGEVSHVLAGAHMAIATVAARRDDWSNALESAQAAQEIYEELSVKDPAIFTVPFLISHLISGSALRATDCYDEAIDQLATAVQIAQGLVKNNAGAYTPLQALAMMMLAEVYNRAGQDDRADEIGRSALDLSRGLVESDPATFLAFFTQVLVGMAELTADNSPREAESFLTEALDACLSTGAESTEYGGPLTQFLFAQKLYFQIDNEWYNDAVKTAEKASHLGRRVMGRSPASKMLMVLTLQGLADAHRELHNESKELATGYEIVGLLRDFAKENVEFQDPLAEALEELSKRLREAGLGGQAAPFLLEAIQVRRGHVNSDEEVLELPTGVPVNEAVSLKDLAMNAGTPNSVVIGRYLDMPIAAAPYRPVLVLGPQRSRKTTGVVIPTLLEWDGPAVVTSVRTDVLASTMVRRRDMGTAQIFEPTGKLYEGPATCRWDPLQDCRNWSGAVRAARWLTEAGAKGHHDGEFWYNLAAQLLAPLLYAAAVSNRSMDYVYNWVKSGEWREVEVALYDSDENARKAWMGISAYEDRMRTSIYGTLSTALSVYESDNVRSSQSKLFDVNAFFDGRPNTLYLCAPPDEQEELSTLFVALVRRLLQEAYDRHSAGEEHNLLVLLDEAGNIAPLRNLDTLATTAAGTGIQLVTVFHDLSQMNTKYRPSEAKTIANNHSAFLLLPGNRDPETAMLVQNLLQEDPIEGEDGSGRKVLRRLKPGTALCFYEHYPPAVIELRSSSHDPDLKTIAAPVEDDPLGRWKRRRPWRA